MESFWEKLLQALVGLIWLKSEQISVSKKWWLYRNKQRFFRLIQNKAKWHKIVLEVAPLKSIQISWTDWIHLRKLKILYPPIQENMRIQRNIARGPNMHKTHFIDTSLILPVLNKLLALKVTVLYTPKGKYQKFIMAWKILPIFL